MTSRTGNGDPWQPMTGAGPDRVKQLGELLRMRRAGLGYRYVPAFVRDREINTRMVGDIEHGRRDTFTFPSLQDAARAYDVTYDSMMDVVWSGAGELIPAAARVLLPSSPLDDRGREDANRPYVTPIWNRLFDLAEQGISDPSGEQLGLSGGDADAWDSSRGALSRSDRAWLVADIQRRRDSRKAAPAAGASSA